MATHCSHPPAQPPSTGFSESREGNSHPLFYKTTLSHTRRHQSAHIMDFDMPTDLINQCQIEFRERAGLSSFDPSDTTLPSPPTVEASISTLDPSPPYLRCKLCQGKLLRGLQSLICVYCGEYQKKDLHPDPISFNSTNGFSWLLQSLNLNGSERVGCLAEGNGVHGGRTPAEDIVSLSELLDLQISWRDNPKKTDSSFNNKVSEHITPLDPGTTNLDDFFTERFASNASEEQQVSSNQDQSKGFETSVPSSIDVNDDDDWNAEFQFADSNDNPKPVDPFVGAEIETETETDLSAHMDAVFGQMEGLSNVKPNEDKGWDDDDLFANMGPTTFQQAGQVDSVVEDEPKDEISGHVNDLSSSKEVEHDLFSDGNWQTSSAHKNDTSQESGSVDWFENADWQKSGKKDFENKSSDIDNSKKQDLETNNDWFQESQWSTGSTKTVVKQEDDEFDDWNDFTSSTGNQDSWKQNSNEKTEKKAELDLFSSTQEVDFGMFPESSTANRNVNGEDGNSKNTPNGNDVEMLMSQMHDLSFMLKSELSIPSKPTDDDDDDFGFSHS